MRKIYFAHPITDYGTERQAVAIAALRDYFAGRYEIENPDQPHHQAGYEARGMNYFRSVVAMCRAAAFMRFPDGSIGAGVGKELNVAYVRAFPMYEVFDGKVYMVSNMPTPILSVDDTRATISRLRAANQESDRG